MKTMLRKTLITLAFALGLTTFAFGDILTEQPYYWYTYDVSYGARCGSAALSTGGNSGNVTVDTVSPWGHAMTVKSGKAGPWGNGKWELGSDNWTLHFRAKMPANLDKGVVISLGSCKVAGGFMLLTRGSDAGVYLANTTSGSAIDTLAISKAGLSSDYHDFTMVFTKSTLKVQLYIDGAAVSEGAFTLSQQVTDKNWQLFSAHGNNSAVKNGFGVYIEEMRFYQKALSASDISTLHNGACSGKVTLTEDTDWSAGIPSEKVRAAIDLNGHKLTLPRASMSDVYNIQNSATGDAATLAFNVASGSATAYGYFLYGNLALVKNGAGTLTLSGYDKLNMACAIDEGTLKLGYVGFADAQTVTIGENGTLDENGIDGTKYKLVMKDGAKLTNTGTGLGVTKAQFCGGLELDENATVYQDTNKEMSFTGSSYAVFPINLNGGTLVERGSGKRSLVNPDITGGGKIVVETCELNVGYNNKGFACADDVTFELKNNSSAFLWVAGDITIPNIMGDGYVASSASALTVSKRLSGLVKLGKANGDNPFTSSKKLTLGDGATLDLNGNTEPYAMHDNFAFGANCVIDVSERDLAIGTQLVAWNASGKPSTTFVWDETTAAKGVELVANAKGIYYGKVVAKADWTNGSGDDDITNPENWTCYDEEESIIEGAVPSAVSDITILEDTEITYPAGNREGSFTLGTGAKLTIDFGEGQYIEGTALLTSSAGTLDLANGTVVVPGGTYELTPDSKQLRYLPKKVMVARWDFNNYDSENPKSTNVLFATEGEPGRPCYKEGSGSEETEDLGEMSITNVVGEAGNYAIAIPKYSHVKLPLPKTLQRGDWTIRMRFFTPEASDKQFRTFFSRDNTADADLFINKSNLVGGGGKIAPSGKYYGSPVEKEKWHLLTVSQRNGYGAMCVDGEQSYTWTDSSKWNFFFDKDYLYLSADNSGEDNLLFVDYIELDVDTGIWTGAAGDNDIANPENWQDGYMPYADGALTADVDLAADADWTAVGSLECGNKTIDLGGYDLAVKPFAGTGKIYDSTTDEENPGAFIVDVDEDATWNNSTFSIQGNLKLVKNGAGAFVGAVADQTYTGGTVINAGSISVTGTKSETEHYFGPRYTGVTVNPDGILDIKRNYSWCYHPTILNGGTINNTAANYTDSAQGLGDITLTADSKMTVKYHTTFNQNNRDGVVNLGGRTLSFEYVTNPGDDKAILHFNGSTVTNGTMVFGQKTKFNPLKTTNIGENVTLVMNGDFFLQNADVTVLNFEDASMGHSQTLQNNHRVHVDGRYTPNSTYLVNATLKNGATLDLTGKTEPWEFVNTLTPQTLAFEDGATITVDVSGRDLTKGDQVVVWSAKPENVTFQWDPTTAQKGVEISVTENGIFYGQVIATAHWTNKLGDGDTTNPENWACTNASGVAVSAVPTDATAVYFAGDAIVAQVTNETTWGTVSFDGALGADCDWSGLGAVNFTDSSIDLKGQMLTVGSLAEGAAAVSITNSATGGAFALSDGTTKLRDGLTISVGVTIYVGGDAVLDTNGKQAETKFALRFADGATLVNTGADVDDTTIQFAGGITLDENATATFDLKYAVNLVAPSYGKYPIALNGGTLVIDNHNDGFSIANGVITGPGTIEAKGAKQFNVGYKGMSIADDVVLKVTKPGWLWSVTGATTIPTIVGDGEVNCRSYAYTITKCLAGSLTLDDTSKGLKLGNGAALDLSMLDDVYAQFGKIKTTADHTYVINLAGRELEPDTKVISWTAIPADVTFVWDEETAKAGEKVVLKEDGLYYGADHASKVVDKAYWTGAVDGDAMNPANWGCTNQAGYVVVDGIPTNTEATVILNNPLAVDCDWTGLGAFAFAKDTLVDLNGHRLAVADFANRTTGVVVTNTVETTGDFVINVPEEKTAENSTVKIAGNVRLVKEGAGTFTGQVKSQSYTGGTLITGGTVKATDYEKYYYLGVKGTDITIETEGTLDLNGWYDWAGHRIVLAGGTLQNTGSSMTTTSWGGIGDVVLTADSKMKLKYHTLFNDNEVTRYVDLGGHTLTADYIACTDPKAIVYVNHNTFKNGTFVMNPGIVLRPVSATGVSGADFTLVVNGDIAPTASDYTIESVVDNSEGRITDGTHVGTITKYYKPASTNFQNFVLADGATLDLTGKTEAWSTASALSGKSVTFAANATNTVDLTGRTIKDGDKIIAWTTQPNATFVFKGYEGDLEPVAEADGLYARLALVQFTIADVENATKVVEGAELVSGNTYSAKPDADVIVTYTANSGYFFKGGSKTAEVKAKAAKDIEIKPSAEQTIEVAAAKIGETDYYTLPEAFAAAPADETVTMLKDVALDKGLDVVGPEGYSYGFTLDMNGKTITAQYATTKAAYDPAISLVSNAYLTITGNGTITGWTGDAAAALDGKSIIAVDGGQLYYENGTLTAGGVGSDGMYGVYVCNGGSAIIGTQDESGAGTGPAITTWFAAIGSNNTTPGSTGVQVIIKGGTFTQLADGTGKWWHYFCAPVYAPAAGTYSILGGTFDGALYSVSAPYANVAQSINLSAGTFADPLYASETQGAGTGTRVIIKGPDAQIDPPAGYKWFEDPATGITTLVKCVAKIGTEYYITLKAANDAAEAGDTIELLADASGEGIFVSKDVTFDFGGFTYTVTSGAVGSPGTESQGFHVETANCTLKNGTVTSVAGSGVKMLVQNYANLTLKDLALDGTNLDVGFKTGDYVLSNNSGDTTLDNVTITAQADDYAFDCDKTATVTLNSGTITGKIAVTGAGPLTINGGTINGPANGKDFDGKAVITVDGGALVFNAGTLNAYGEGDSGMYGVYVKNGAAATFGTIDESGAATGPAITAWFAAIGANNTTAGNGVNIVVNGGSYTQLADGKDQWWSYFCAAVYAPAAGTYTINGGTFDGAVYSISAPYANAEQTITVAGGTLSDPLYVSETQGAGTGTRVVTVGPTVQIAAPAGYAWEIDASTGYKTLKRAGAKIGTTYYVTLADANAAAVKDDVIELLADASGDGIFVSVDNLTFDFGGFTYTVTSGAVGSPGTESQGFHVETAACTLKNGTVTSVSGSGVKMLVQNYADLTLKDLALDGTNLDVGFASGDYVLSNNSGNTTLDNVTITAQADDFAFDSDKTATVTLNSGTINGKIEVASSLIINGGTISGPANGKDYDGKAVITVDGGALVFNAGTLNAYGEGDSGMYGVYVKKGGTATFEQPTITSWFAAIGANNTTAGEGVSVTVNGGTYTQLADGKDQWWHYFCAAVYAPAEGAYTIKGGTFTGALYCLAAPYANVEQTIAFEGGTFNKPLYAAEGQGAGTGTRTITKAEGVQIDPPTGYAWKDNVLVKCAAKIGTQYYITLKEANDAAKANDTIELLANVADGDGIFVSKDVTFDFGGFAYTVAKNPVGSTGTESQGFHIETANCVLTNGTITSTSGSGVKMLVQNYANLTVTDMTLDGTKLDTGFASGDYVLSNNKGNITLDNVTIAAQADDYAFDVDKTATVTLNSGTINGKIAVTGAGPLTINGGTINGPTNGAAYDGKAVITVDGGTLVFNAGTLTATGAGDSGMYGVYVKNGGAATFGTAQGGPTITAWFAAIGTNNTTPGLEGVTITINNGTYTQLADGKGKWWSYFCAAVYAPAAGTYTVNGGTLDGALYSIAMPYENVEQTITITGGTLDPLFVAEGEGAGIGTRTIKVGPAVDVPAPAGYAWEVDASTGYKTLKKAVVKVGNAYYLTLKDANDAAEANQTIELLASSAGDGIFVAKDNLTFDFGGFTYTITGNPVGSKGTESQGFHIEAANCTLKDGTLTSVNGSGVKMLVQNYSSLTVENMFLDGTRLPGGETRYVLSNNAGNTVVKASTITAKEGDFAFDSCKYSIYDAPTVTVNGGSEINGNIELTGGNLALAATQYEQGVLNGTIVNKNQGTGVATKDFWFAAYAPAGYRWGTDAMQGTLVKIDYSEYPSGVKVLAETEDEGIPSDVTIPQDWLVAKGADPIYAKNAWANENDLTVAVSYVLGLDPKNPKDTVHTVSLTLDEDGNVVVGPTVANIPEAEQDTFKVKYALYGSDSLATEREEWPLLKESYDPAELKDENPSAARFYETRLTIENK